MLPWILAALCLLWALYECFRPRPIIARFVPTTDREDELLHRCIDLTNTVDAYHEIVADFELELARLLSRVQMQGSRVATAATDGGPG